MRNNTLAALLTAPLALGCLQPGPGPAPLEALLPDVTLATFVDGVDHPYFPLPIGATWVIEAQTDGGLERIEIEVLADPREVNGVTATQVRDTALLDGVIREDTIDWYAQDGAGNVWYLGEDTCEFEDGACVSREGSWEFGVDNAKPGFALPANLVVDGQPYYQEFYVGHAEDIGEIIAVGESVTVPAGSYDDCVRTHDTSALDPTLDEEKVYCRDVGNVLVLEGDVHEQLVETSLP